MNPLRKHRIVRTGCGAVIACFLLWLLAEEQRGLAAQPNTFRVWAAGDSHVTADIRHGRESLAKAIRQSQGEVEGAPPFDWDIMVDAGDLSASQFPPTDEDGRELVRQYGELAKHRREDVYNVPGNHDGTYYDQGIAWWFRKWADPLGENTQYSGVDASRRRFPVEGTWERCRFQAGNLLFLMLSDRNSAPAPVGRGHSSQRLKGGFPAGAVTRETFEWWKTQVLENQDAILITVHHHVLRGTTTRSGYGEGKGFHGASGGIEGSSYLYFTIENESPENFRFSTSTPDHPGPFETFLEQFQKEHDHPAMDLWIGGHTHAISPDQQYNGKGLVAQRWGVTFVQVAGLTRYHAAGAPMSRLLTFTGGSDMLRMDLYLHEPYKSSPVGWYPPASRKVKLRHAFRAPPKR